MNNGTYQPFVRAKEDSWQRRYDFDFAVLGVSGLTLMTHYVAGEPTHQIVWFPVPTCTA
ncbi:OprD family outer membrane porin [Pseudomonas putida]